MQSVFERLRGHLEVRGRRRRDQYAIQTRAVQHLSEVLEGLHSRLFAQCGSDVRSGIADRYDLDARVRAENCEMGKPHFPRTQQTCSDHESSQGK